MKYQIGDTVLILHSSEEGQVVDIIIDGYPDHEITGTISDFSDATGAKFSLLPPEGFLKGFLKKPDKISINTWRREKSLRLTL